MCCFGHPHLKRKRTELKKEHNGAARMIKGVEHLSNEEKRILGEKKDINHILVELYNVMHGTEKANKENFSNFTPKA